MYSPLNPHSPALELQTSSQHEVLQQHPTQAVGIVRRGSANAREQSADLQTPRAVHGPDDNCVLVFRNMTLAAMEDRRRAKQTGVGCLASRSSHVHGKLIQVCQEYASGTPTERPTKDRTGIVAVPAYAGVQGWVNEGPYAGVGAVRGRLHPVSESRVGTCDASGASTATTPLSVTTGQSASEPLVCSIDSCNRHTIPFNNVHDRRQHESRVHGEKEDRPHSCPHDSCEEAFNHPHELKRHINSIHAKTPVVFECHICKKTYKRLDGLYRHQDGKHAHIPPTAVCSICLQTFGHRLATRDEHVRRQHPAEANAISLSRAALSAASETSTSGFRMMTPTETFSMVSSAAVSLVTPSQSGSSV